MIKVKDLAGRERECSFVKMQMSVDFLDASGDKYDVYYLVYGVDYSVEEFRFDREYLIDTFSDYDRALAYFARLKYAVDSSEGCKFTPDELPFP